ncbi:ATP-binding protein [Kurthia sibirica]|uniref:histidine kinase n=1 Tax=Kurthia sibirica TaxID=202750 RepID=A0A2U3AN39_9BACL|nr:sensor histidine kinase [Kurthia sibirica]PWI25935.1 histidine kinase [Kurthia sibirica]GEK35139.1 putative C4-dicarboxylate sensor kinase [Kurthia sibirica]
MKLTINRRITALIFFVILFSLTVAGIFILGSVIKSKESELTEKSMLVARTVASLPEIQQTLNTKQMPEAQKIKTINRIVEEVRTIQQAQYIVVTDMHHIRYSHPIHSMLGQVTQTPDDLAAYSEHYYSSIAKGEIGTVTRSFVPIMNSQHKQIGIVNVGYRLPTLIEIVLSMKIDILFAILLSMIFGFWGAYILSRSIKKQMLNYEPHEIAQLYIERTETFNAMHEGIVAIDNEHTITLFNSKARSILGVVDQQVIGRNIRDVIPDTRLPEILDLNRPLYNKELFVNQHTILSNRVPIIVEGQTVGAIAIFQDRTDVKKMAEELTGVKEFVQALRIQNHEHKNKLHTIAGLLQLKNYTQALTYIVDIQEEQDELTDFLNKRLQNQNIAGLVLSKINRGKELGIQVELDHHSQLQLLPATLDFHDFVIVVGNLIENAFDALQLSNRPDKKLFISIDQDEAYLSILLEDNGIGMNETLQKNIFNNGFTTKKSTNHGIGLYLIQDIVKKAQGVIEVNSIENNGTTISIMFPME